MKNPECLATMNGLLDLLEIERSALLAGKLDEVARLQPRKEALSNDLSRLASETHGSFSIIRDRAFKNQILMSAALEGIRAVATRLAAIEKVRQTFDSYDGLGRKKTVDIRSSVSVERRA